MQDRDKIHNHTFTKLNNLLLLLEKKVKTPYWDRQLPKILPCSGKLTAHLYHWNVNKVMISGHKWNTLKMSIQWQGTCFLHNMNYYPLPCGIYLHCLYVCSHIPHLISCYNLHSSHCDLKFACQRSQCISHKIPTCIC